MHVCSCVSQGVLGICSNQVSEVDQLGYLGLCGELSSLTLAGNPLAQHIADQQV